MPSLYPPADPWGPLVSSVFPTASADPGRDSSALPLPRVAALRLGCHRAFTAPLIICPLNPLQTET
jgi:hypothetical protein